MSAVRASVWVPVGEPERIFTLDALRGVAIFGVLVANVLTFAFPAWSAPAPGSAEGEQVLPLLVAFLVEGKFYVLFALLFGMGLGLQSARAEASGRTDNSATPMIQLLDVTLGRVIGWL